MPVPAVRQLAGREEGGVMATIYATVYFAGGTATRLWFTDIEGRTCGLVYYPASFRRTAR